MEPHELVQLYLLSASLDRTGLHGACVVPGHLHARIDYKSGLVDASPEVMIVTVMYHLGASYALDSAEVLKIDATFCAFYKFSASQEGMSQEQLQAMTDEAVSDTWLPWRDFAQTMMLKMDLPPLRIPTVLTGIGQGKLPVFRIALE